MVSSSVIATVVSVASVAALTNSSSKVLNIINPLFALPSGKNSTGPLGASIVGVDATATTYLIGCNGLYSHTKNCGWSTAPPNLVTQGSTSEHFSYTDSNEFGESLTFTGDYTYASTLAPIATGTFSVGDVRISYEEQTTTTNYVSSTFSEATTETSATWYVIPITAGLEKLNQATTTTGSVGAQSTATSISGSGSASRAGGVPTTASSAAGGERMGGRAGVVAGVVGGVGVIGGLLL
ncbi:hypothetical protein DL95DRAFT_378045 [Leptodontidium sp. 2 PMI_412]|nr:hypothetical protein DL95DRAFT_378045 [Leptodontidium sp. 2 PMI_412]